MAFCCGPQPSSDAGIPFKRGCRGSLGISGSLPKLEEPI